ncbi:MAG: SCP2 sterol-binding domain-containing protein [Candidatus Lokiarchaeota archaeon]|nr:SCP2 sterol-binding domain-containing protein [Candidatus Lokiarchaeota archaeon]
MVDEALINELKEKLDAGAASAEPEDALKCFELYNQIANEMEDLKEELEDIEITVQIILTDVDKKYWIKAVEGKLSYGDGEVENPSFTFSATKEIGIGMLFGEVDATSAYMAGDITVEGNLQDANLSGSYQRERIGFSRDN